MYSKLIISGRYIMDVTPCALKSARNMFLFRTLWFPNPKIQVRKSKFWKKRNGNGSKILKHEHEHLILRLDRVLARNLI